MSQGLARVGLRQISWPAADVKPKRFLEEEEKKEKKKVSSYLPDKMKLNELCWPLGREVSSDIYIHSEHPATTLYLE